MKYLAYVAYKGANYFGFQRQSEKISIQGEIERFLTFYLGEKTLIHGSGRTDAKVNALAQAFSFEAKRALDKEDFLRYAQKGLASDISIYELIQVDDDFDARLRVKEKTYGYVIRNKGGVDPFKSDISYQFNDDRFSLDKYVEALNLFLGKHDFHLYTSKSEDKDDYIRDIKKITFNEYEDGYFEVELTSKGFMRYMVRSLVGEAINYAKGLLDKSVILDRLEGIGTPTTFIAPGMGLTLKRVSYEGIKETEPPFIFPFQKAKR